MKKIPLSQGKYALVDDADYDWLNSFKWYAHSSKRSGTYYAIKSSSSGGIKSGTKMHRLILGVNDPKIFVDHEDGNGLNCQRYNIRECTNQQNLMNRGSQVNGQSKFKGVSPYPTRNKFVAKIMINKKQKHIGYYDTEIEAALAYNQKAVELFGDFAKLNTV